MVAIPLVSDRQIDLIETAIAALVAADQQDGLAFRIEGEEHPPGISADLDPQLFHVPIG
jgi:hypothetical protein